MKLQKKGKEMPVCVLVQITQFLPHIYEKK